MIKLHEFESGSLRWAVMSMTASDGPLANRFIPSRYAEFFGSLILPVVVYLVISLAHHDGCKRPVDRSTQTRQDVTSICRTGSARRKVLRPFQGYGSGEMPTTSLQNRCCRASDSRQVSSRLIGIASFPKEPFADALIHLFTLTDPMTSPA